MCRLGDHDATTLAASLSLSRSLSLSFALTLSLSLSPAVSLCFLASLLFVANHQASHLQAIPYLVCLPQLWLVGVALTISYVDYLPVLTFPTDLSNRMLLLYSMCGRW